jgi:phage tail tape-measure protein
MAVAKSVAKQTRHAVEMHMALQGGRIVARRAWNTIRGKKNPPLSEDLKEFFESSLKGGGNIAVQTAVAGGVVVAARNGWIKVLQNTPAGKIANIVYVGLENAKILYKVAKGEITWLEAKEAMEKTTVSVVGGIIGAGKGAALGGALGAKAGAFIGSVVPFAGTAVGAAVGGAIGSFVGAVAGGMAGSGVAELVHEGYKKARDSAQKAISSVRESISSAAELLLAPLVVP